MTRAVPLASLLVLLAALSPAFSLAGEPAAPPAEKPGMADLLTLASPPEKDVEFDLDGLRETVGRAVVKITFTPIANMAEIKADPRQQEQYWGGWSSEPAHGSGFFIDPAGHVITNAHVVDTANRRTIKCKSPATGNTTFELELIGVGNTGTIDIALLKLKDKEIPRFKKLAGFDEIPFLKVTDSDAISQTEKIAVMGYPEDSDDMRVKGANLSGRQYLEGYWELIGGFQFLEVATASAVQSGNSGGAAVDRFGHLVGIPARGDWTDRTGWLIPSNVLLRFMAEVRKNDQGKRKLELLSLGILTEKTFPGIAVLAGVPQDMVDNEIGITVKKVSKKTLGEELGIRQGDILLGFRNAERDIHVYLDFEGKVKTTGAMKVFRDGDRSWDNSQAPRRALSELILMSSPGQEVEILYVRRGVQGIQSFKSRLYFREVLNVPQLGLYEVPDYVEWAGMILQNFHDNNIDRHEYYTLGALMEEGAVVVTHIDSGSLGQERGLTNRTISAVNGMRVKSLADLRGALKKINDDYDAWRKTPGWSSDKARYDPRNYAVLTYHEWDGERSELVKREVTVPIEEARAVGRSLDKAEEK